MAENLNSIPKVIHYCWFGNNPLPELALKCIGSWHKYCPDYEIKEWNESNFDLNCCDYVKEACEEKKWAFVSDYARFWILYNYGGLYFDTDVELIMPVDDIVAKGPFMGCEPAMGGAAKTKSVKGEKCAPGLGLGVNPGLGLYRKILDFYERIHFKYQDGRLDLTTIVTHTTDILKKSGFKEDGTVQYIEGIYIYPADYFCPLNYFTGEITLTDNTRSIHHYSESWYDETQRKMSRIGRKINSLLGIGIGYKIMWLYGWPSRIGSKIRRTGIINTVRYYAGKYLKLNRE